MKNYEDKKKKIVIALGHEALGTTLPDQKVAVRKTAKAVADLIEAKFPKLNGKVEINHIGTTIGSHTGPGTVALFFWGKKRVD